MWNSSGYSPNKIGNDVENGGVLVGKITEQVAAQLTNNFLQNLKNFFTSHSSTLHTFSTNISSTLHLPKKPTRLNLFSSYTHLRATSSNSMYSFKK